MPPDNAVVPMALYVVQGALRQALFLVPIVPNAAAWQVLIITHPKMHVLIIVHSHALPGMGLHAWRQHVVRI